MLKPCNCSSICIILPRVVGIMNAKIYSITLKNGLITSFRFQRKTIVRFDWSLTVCQKSHGATFIKFKMVSRPELLWHNRLARSAVLRKVGGSSPPGRPDFANGFFLQYRLLLLVDRSYFVVMTPYDTLLSRLDARYHSHVNIYISTRILLSVGYLEIR